ncbi:translocation/assembly module TamB domain-containing protein [Paracoccus zeaxanthinifaciens]|uniref:translocation/assembly module TamB domain-containing protein n=1 Tax=Paracoccus zeaxanthinifaciens TaxID=187400 RepID=UPI0003B35D04|nr:translocation/assembly module TamB domain-containing protein [Paracoccus zeaxanthinifaciens]
MRRFLIITAVTMLPLAVLAQDIAEIAASESDDKGFLTRLLEKNLSGEGRQITIIGFEGALSSRATFDEIRIADEDGAWLTLKDGAIQWNRSALLRRRVEIAELSASEIDLPRLPGGEKDEVQAEATPFALPELPVSLNIEEIRADRVRLGEPVMGVAASLKVAGNLGLAGGEGDADLTIDRLDGPRGQFVLDAGYSNETEVLRLNLGLDEAEDGILANLVGIHDRPALAAQISGEGALSDFAADIRLSSDGQPRITGRVSAAGTTDDTGATGTGFDMWIGGDIAALLPPDDRAFFGRDTQLVAQGFRADTGRLSIPELDLRTSALHVEGQLATNDQSAPERALLTVTLGKDAGAAELPVALPMAGENATVESGRLLLDYDAAQGEGWTLSGNIGQLDTGSVRMGDLNLNGAGEVLLDGGALTDVTGALEFAAEDMGFVDPGLTEAIGTAITGRADFDFAPGNALDIRDVTLEGADFGLDGDFLVAGLDSGITLTADATARYGDLARISTLAGRPMSGAADASLRGYYTLLTDGFDIQASIAGDDITLDQPQLDGLLRGRSTIDLDARRDETGTTLDALAIRAQGLTADASGTISSDASDVTARIEAPSLAQADETMGGSLDVTARMTGPNDARKLLLDGQAVDLRVGIEMLDKLMAGRTDLTAEAVQSDDSYVLQGFQVSNPQFAADAQGSFAPGDLDAEMDLSLTDLGRLQDGWSGGLDANATLSEADGTRSIRLTGTGQDLSLGTGPDALTGTTRLLVEATEKDGVLTISDGRVTNDQLRAVVSGVLGQGVTDLGGDVEIASLAPFGQGWQGSVTASGTFAEAGDGIRRLSVDGTGRDLSFGQAQVDGALAGETRLRVAGTEQDGVFSIETAQVENPRLQVEADGRVGGGETDVTADLRASDLRFLGGGFGGSVNAQLGLTETADGRSITANGTADGLRIGQEKADAVLAGQTSFDLAASQGAGGVTVQRLDLRNPQVSLVASGSPAAGIDLDGRLANLELLVPNFAGPVTLDGVVREQGATYALDLDATAPGDTRLAITGTAAKDGSDLDIGIDGRSSATLANMVMRTRNFAGPLDIALRIDGPPALQSLGGQIRLSDGQMVDPGLGLRLQNMDFTMGFRGGIVDIDGLVDVAAGGQMRMSGPFDITRNTLDLGIGLRQVKLRDPNLYETLVDGDITIAGNLAAGPLVSGQIDLLQTEFRIPSTGLGGATAIPDINHVGSQRPPVRATRARAGLEGYPSRAASEAGLGGPPATPPANPPRLDLVINAQNQVFVRGRGVDAEMGGGFRIQGTSRNVVPIGNLELIRGRVDLLGNRFDLTEGLVELQGSLIPVIRLVAETDRDGITTRIIIDGEVRDPEITFESSPELPQEEVLSQLLFGRGLDNISPLQAAQLANAIAVLAGRGGDGIIGNLRESAGLDDLDLTTDDDGNVQVRAGRYISENVYTDVAVDADGTSTINLNLDLTNSLRARGSVGSDGTSSVGVFFERDY